MPLSGKNYRSALPPCLPTPVRECKYIHTLLGCIFTRTRRDLFRAQRELSFPLFALSHNRKKQWRKAPQTSCYNNTWLDSNQMCCGVTSLFSFHPTNQGLTSYNTSAHGTVTLQTAASPPALQPHGNDTTYKFTVATRTHTSDTWLLQFLNLIKLINNHGKKSLHDYTSILDIAENQTVSSDIPSWRKRELCCDEPEVLDSIIFLCQAEHNSFPSHHGQCIQGDHRPAMTNNGCPTNFLESGYSFSKSMVSSSTLYYIKIAGKSNTTFYIKATLHYITLHYHYNGAYNKLST